LGLDKYAYFDPINLMMALTVIPLISNTHFTTFLPGLEEVVRAVVVVAVDVS
jgi:hypothetical protein